MRKNNVIQIRITESAKKEFKKMAAKNGFKTITDFIMSLVGQSKNATKLIIIFCLMSLAGCATPDYAKYFPTNDIQSLPPTQSIEVVYENPQRQYTVLGKIVTEIYGWAGSYTPDEKLLQSSKEKAMKIGANALFVKSIIPVDNNNDIDCAKLYRMESLALKWEKDSKITKIDNSATNSSVLPQN